MPSRSFRHAQFCPIARAAEVLGERWTLLIVRELLLGPARFSDLRRRLGTPSPSVLATRLADLEHRGLIARRDQPPPAPAQWIVLTPLGESLRPAVLELARWGAQLLGTPAPDDHFEADWLRLTLDAFTKREPTPMLRAQIEAIGTASSTVFQVRGGPGGTSVEPASESFDLRVSAEPAALYALVSGQLGRGEALADPRIAIEGDTDRLAHLPRLFDLADFGREPEQNGFP